MKKYAFIGGYDKTELLLFLGKIAALAGKKVLIVDATVPQKARYIVPVMNPTQNYITTFEDLDIAVGFYNFNEILEYTLNQTLDYDMVLLDIDSPEAYMDFGIESTDEHCFVTGFDLYSIRTGIETLQAIQNQTRVTKIYFTRDMLPEEDEYIMAISYGLNVIWNDEIIFFPFERGDRNVLNINQRFSKIKIKGLSKDYIDALMFIAEENLGLKDGEVRASIKIMEKA
ncbi:MAG: hypothetical protein IKM97_04375 [Clostridia bacterium]|nr:hypothetical protein [Clostridia bacterium]